MQESATPHLFWENQEMVARFAARDPDHRLQGLVSLYPGPERVRVLDLGCAAGRNTVFLARNGFDVSAVDGSKAMIQETRTRVAEILGPGPARSRVTVARMTDLSAFPDDWFDLVVALGIYHGASSREEWDAALRETFRVLGRGGVLLVANHTSSFDPSGSGLDPVPGEPHLFDGLPSGRSFLVDGAGLDREMARHGATPLSPTQTVIREMEGGGRRATANAIYLCP